MFDRKCPYCGTPILGYTESCHPCLIAVVIRERQKKADANKAPVLLNGLK